MSIDAGWCRRADTAAGDLQSGRDDEQLEESIAQLRGLIARIDTARERGTVADCVLRHFDCSSEPSGPCRQRAANKLMAERAELAQRWRMRLVEAARRCLLLGWLDDDLQLAAAEALQLAIDEAKEHRP